MKKKTLDLFVPSKAPSYRQNKVAQEIRHCLAEALMRGDIPSYCTEEGKFISLNHPVTLTDVQVSPDLQHATIFVMPLGGQMQEETIKFLQLSSGFFRKTVAHKIQLRYAPTLTFMLDQGFSASEKIDQLLKKI